MPFFRRSPLYWGQTYPEPLPEPIDFGKTIKSTNGEVIMATGLFEELTEHRDGIMVYIKPKGLFGNVISLPKDWWNSYYSEEKNEDDDDIF